MDLLYTVYEQRYEGKLYGMFFDIAPSLEAGRRMTNEQRKTARRAAKKAAEQAAAKFGSCAATTGLGYYVSAFPLPPCTCR